MPRFGVLELSAVLEKGLVADHDHMALAVEVQVLLVVLATADRFDGALGVGNLQLQGLLDEGVDRALGDVAVQAGDHVADVLAEYKERSLQWLRELEQAGNPASRLAPLIWKVFGMQAELHAYRRNLPDDTSAAHKAWLERVSEA